jgi:hypothetical protein
MSGRPHHITDREAGRVPKSGRRARPDRGFVVSYRSVPAFVIAIGTALVRPTVAQEKPATCASCHAVRNSEVAASVHAALKCQECHGGAEAFSVDPGTVAAMGAALDAGKPAGTFDHGAGFAGRPSRAEIPESCGNCHADAERMNPYGIRIDQLARYWTSGHGKTLKVKGDDRVAVCTDCHGVHDIRPGHQLGSKTHPFNVPDTCGSCHTNASLMGDYELPVEVVDEYRRSVHGVLLLDKQDSGAPTCATCHGNHSAIPPGFATVGAVCGQCHQHAEASFATSIHAEMPEHKGCVQCHGGGEGRHYHLIEPITNPAGIMIQRYAHLLSTEPSPTREQVAEAIHPNPKQIITRALPTCTECHESLEDDESLPKLFTLLDAIAEAEHAYVRTGKRLDDAAQGILLVDRQNFLFQDAKTHLIELAPLQHTLDNEKVAAKVAELNEVCGRVNQELDELQAGLAMRERMLVPIWGFAVVFSALLYVKYKQLKKRFVKPIEARSS